MCANLIFSQLVQGTAEKKLDFSNETQMRMLKTQIESSFVKDGQITKLMVKCVVV
jgi:hypothetical protein